MSYNPVMIIHDRMIDDQSWGKKKLTDENNAKQIGCQHLFNEETTTLTSTG